MTENTPRRSYKLEDVPLTRSVEHIDSPEANSEISDVDNPTYYDSNNPSQQAANHPEVQILDAVDNNHSSHSIQRQLNPVESISENKSKLLQTLDRTAEVHNYSILPETTQEEEQYATNRIMNTHFGLDEQRTKRTRELDLGENFTEKVGDNLEMCSDVQRAYKNYEITHDQELKSSDAGFYVTGPVDDIELMDEEQMNIDEEDQEGLRQEETREVQRRALLNNPGIGSLISESSKQIDKINKMLEEHRRKKAAKITNQAYDITESGNSENPFDQQTSNNTELIQEDLSIPESINKFADSKGNTLVTGGEGPVLQERVSGDSAGASEDSLGDKIKSTTERPREVIDSSGQASLDNLVENMITAREEHEAAFRDENGIDRVTLGRVDEEMGAQKYGSLGSKELREGKKLNKIQLDYAKYQAESQREGRVADPNQQRQHVGGINKASSGVDKRISKQTKRSQEKYTPSNQRKDTNSKFNNKEEVANFFSIDIPRQTHKAKSSVNKDKGSYLKKFLEYKEKRRQQDQANQNNGSKSPKQSSGSSRSSNRSAYKLSSKDSKGVRQTVGSSMGVDSGDYNTRSEKSIAKERSSAPNPYAKGFMNDALESSDKKPKNMKLTRYNEFRDVHRNSKKENLPNPLEQQLSKLDLDHIHEDQAQEADNSTKHKNGSVDPKLKNKMQINMDKVGINHSVSVGKFNPLNSRGRNHEDEMEYTRPVPQTSRAVTNRDYDTSRSRKAEKINKENINHEQQNQEMQRGDAQIGTGESSGATSSMTCKVTHESLLKSLKLRQEVYSRVFKNGKHHDGQVLGERKDGGISMNALLTKRKEEEDRSMYNKNVKWLMSKQRKLDEMHHKEIEQEMKECTFKPHLVTKELNLKQDLNLCDYVTRARVIDPVSRALIIEQK